VFFAVITLFVCAACSKSEPKIAYGFMELVYYQGEGRPEERFSFFLIPEDNDGIEDLSDLYIYHDGEGLRWHLLPEDWVSYEQDDKHWIGSRAIAMSENESLPRGNYRAVLVNKGGEQSERVFVFDAPEENPYPFPYLTINDGRYRIDSLYPENKFICYDGQGNFLEVKQLDAPEGALLDIDLPSAARTVAIWAEDSEYQTSALTDAALIR
jgi:hypothetical protein